MCVRARVRVCRPHPIETDPVADAAHHNITIVENTGRGCVLVSSVAAGSNAEKAGKILVGDMICYLGKEPKNMVRE